MGKVKKQLAADFVATRADLTTRIDRTREAMGDNKAVGVASDQLARGDRLASEERSASAIPYYKVGQTMLELSKDAHYGRNLLDRSKDGARRTNSAGTERHQQLLDRIRPNVLDLRLTDPNIKNPQIVQHLLDQHADLCQFERADGSTKLYSDSALDKAVREIRKES